MTVPIVLCWKVDGVSHQHALPAGFPVPAEGTHIFFGLGNRELLVEFIVFDLHINRISVHCELYD